VVVASDKGYFSPVSTPFLPCFNPVLTLFNPVEPCLGYWGLIRVELEASDKVQFSTELPLHQVPFQRYVNPI